MSTKRCTKCGVEKDVSLFGKFYAGKDGRSSWCKTCINSASKECVKARLRSDPKFKEEYIIRLENLKRVATCNILKRHHDVMKDDPEHLTTEFLQDLIGIDCK